MMLIHLREHGLFSNINEALDLIWYLDQRNKGFQIRWGRNSFYYCKEFGDKDVWEYYFEPTKQAGEFESLTQKQILDLIRFTKPFAPRTGKLQGLAQPNRSIGNTIINKHLKINKKILEAAQEYHNAIGLHIRGPGRIDPPVNKLDQLNQHFVCEHGVPFELYFHEIDSSLASGGFNCIYLATDSDFVFTRLKTRYGRLLIGNNLARSKFGEDHTKVSGDLRAYNLGKEALIDALSLSNCGLLIHGNSNLSNFVLCYNPTLINDYVYDNGLKRLGLSLDNVY